MLRMTEFGLDLGLQLVPHDAEGLKQKPNEDKPEPKLDLLWGLNSKLPTFISLPVEPSAVVENEAEPTGSSTI